MENKLLEMLTEIRPEFDFNESDDYVADGYLDSFDIVTLISMIEEELGVSIDGLDIVPENFKNIESITAMIQRSK